MHKLLFSLSYRREKIEISIFVDFFKELMNYYAVAKGRSPGIYGTWDECKAQVHKFPGPIYKKFKSKNEAENFIKEHAGATSYFPKVSVSTGGNTLFSGQKTYALGKNKSSLTGNASLKRLMASSSDSDSGESETISSKKKKYKLDGSNHSKTDNGFIVDENGFTEVYTDGACTSNGRGNAKAGVGIWFSDNNPYNVSEPVIGRATNNMAEIQAVTIAARQAQKAGIKKLKINTDSKFLISCITKWMPKWKKCGWQTAEKKPVINKVELIEMEKALQPLEICWNHVRGHVGIYGNEMADKFARQGSERYKRT